MAEMNENFSNSRVSETISKTVLSNMKEIPPEVVSMALTNL